MGEQIDLKELREEIHLKSLKWRNLYRLVTSQKFYRIFTQATFQERQIILTLCRLGSIGDVNKLKEYINKIGKNEIKNLSLNQLRKEASRLGIQYYNEKTKIILTQEIKAALKGRNYDTSSTKNDTK